jgi:hypothetical protein
MFLEGFGSHCIDLAVGDMQGGEAMIGNSFSDLICRTTGDGRLLAITWKGE